MLIKKFSVIKQTIEEREFLELVPWRLIKNEIFFREKVTGNKLSELDCVLLPHPKQRFSDSKSNEWWCARERESSTASPENINVNKKYRFGLPWKFFRNKQQPIAVKLFRSFRDVGLLVSSAFAAREAD